MARRAAAEQEIEGELAPVASQTIAMFGLAGVAIVAANRWHTRT